MTLDARRLGQLAVKHGLATRAAVDAALAADASDPQSLVRAGVLTAAQLAALYDIASCELAQDDDGARHARMRLEIAPPAPANLHAEIAEAERDPKRRFGPYVLLREIGRGGMGIVYRAWSPAQRRLVAIKVLPSDLDRERQRFQREARTAAELQHPNIVRVHDIGAVADRHYYAMDYIDGRPLSAVFERGAMPWPNAVRILVDAATAVHFAHERGIIHRDIKPANILVDRSDRPFLLDFGLAKSERDPSLTMTGQIMGSPTYMSPEQAEGRTYDVSARSDVYGLGAVLYHAVAGRPPFAAADFGSLFDMIRREKPQPPSRHVPGLPPDLDAAILKCLEKKSQDRHASALDLAVDLRRLLRGKTPMAKSETVTDARATDLPPESKDGLTGLASRRHLFRWLETNMVGTVSLLLVDFDGLKKVNETLGERTGDAVLRQFAALLRETAPRDAVLGRHGGDSFLAALPGRGKDDAVALGNALRAKLAQKPLGLADRPASGLTLSAGVATFPDDAPTHQKLVDATNRALYVSKRVGRNCVSAAGRMDEDVAGERDAVAVLPCREFIGRDDEMGEAIGLFDDLCNRRPVLAFVHGESGIGKSRFLREYAARATNAGVIHLYVGCDEAKKYVPCHALLQFVDRFFEKRPASQQALRRRLTSAQRAAAREYVPAFASWLPEPAEPPAKDRRALMQQAIELAIPAIAEEAPILFVLDNAAWADRTTLDVLRALVRGRKHPIGLAFALRGDLTTLDAKRDAPLFDLVAEVEKRGARTLQLRPLACEHVEQLVRAVLPGAELPEGFAETVAEASGGNPLYAEQVLRLLMMTGKIRRERRAWRIAPVSYGDLPPSLDEAVREMIAKLPPEANDVLTNAAVLGATFDFRALQAVSGLREGEMLDLVDQMQDLGLLRADPSGRDTDIEFAAGHVREVRYAAIPESRKRELHDKAAQVLVEMTGVTGAREAGYHAARALGREPVEEGETGDGVRMEVVGLVPVRRARIPEATAALAPRATDLALRFAAALASAIKVGRLYPKDSKIREELRDKVRGAATDLVEAASPVTLSSDASVNGQPMPKHADEARDVAAVLADHLVSSLTLKAGVTRREVDALLEALSAPMRKETAPADHWDRWLEERKIENFDVLQRRYVAQEDLQAEPEQGAPESPERPLKVDEVAMLWTALRHLKAAVDALRLYPTGHTLVDEGGVLAGGAFRDLLAKVKVVSIATPEDVVVNGTPVDARTTANVAAFLVKEFRTKEIRTLRFEEGVTVREVRALVSALAAADPQASARAAAGLQHIAFDGRTYERVTAGTMKRGREMRDSKVVERAGAQLVSVEQRELSLEESAKALLASAVPDFASPETERALPSMLGALLADKKLEPLADGLAARVASCLRETDAPVRRQAAVIAMRCLLEGSAAAKARALERFQDQLLLSLGSETAPEVLAPLAEAARHWISAAYAAELFKPLVSFMAAVLAAPPARAPVLRTAATATAKLLSTRLPNPAVEMLASPDVKLQRAAARVVAMMGAAIVPPLVSMVLTSDDAGARRTAAAALKVVGGTGARQLAAIVKPETPAARAVRVLDVFELCGAEEVGSVALAAQGHADATVREAGFRLLRRGGPLTRWEAVRDLMKLESADAQMAALTVAKDLRLRELGPDVIALCEATADETLLRNACHYFRECPSAQAVPVLERIFGRKSRLFGLVKGMTTKTRAAAVEAAARISDPDARRIIEEAAEDKSGTVRRAAQSPPPSDTRRWGP